MKVKIVKSFPCSINGFDNTILEPGVHEIDDFLANSALRDGYAEKFEKVKTEQPEDTVETPEDNQVEVSGEDNQIEVSIVAVETTEEKSRYDELKEFTVPELKNMCSEMKIKGYTKLETEDELIKAIIDKEAQS